MDSEQISPPPLTQDEVTRIPQIRERLNDPRYDIQPVVRCDLLYLLIALDAAWKERDALQKRLDTNRCNSGHLTLPLTLWDCPECHNLTRAERDALHAELTKQEEWCAVHHSDKAATSREEG